MKMNDHMEIEIRVQSLIQWFGACGDSHAVVVSSLEIAIFHNEYHLCITKGEDLLMETTESKGNYQLRICESEVELNRNIV